MKDKTNKINLSDAKRHFQFISQGNNPEKAIFTVVRMSPFKDRPRFKFIRAYEELEQFLTHYSRNKSVEDYSFYICPNSFYTFTSRSSKLHKLNCVFVDIDAHCTGKESLDPHYEMYDENGIPTERALESLLHYLREEVYGKLVPWPSMAVKTGRGVQLYWKIKPISYNYKNIRFWDTIERAVLNNLQKEFCFKEFQIDMAVKNANRILRLAGTFNPKAGRWAEIVEYNDNVYTLSELSEWVFGGVSTGRKFKRYRRSKKANKKGKNSVRRNNLYKMLEERLADLETLLVLRKGRMTGCRQNYLFIILAIMCNLGRPNEEIQQMLRITNNRFTKPLQEREIRYLLHRRVVYIFTSDVIIDMLGITKREQRHMRTIIASQTKQEKLLQERAERKEASKREKDLKQKAVELEMYRQWLDGCSVKEIAAKMNVSSATVRKYLKSTTPTLSKRQQVEDLQACGYTKQQVAEKLKISMRTVNRYWKK